MKVVLRKIRNTNKTLVISFVSIAIISSLGISIYGYITTSRPKAKPEVKAEKQENPAAKQQKDMLQTAAKQIELPTNEQPIIATITSKELLSNQDFFRDALDGDKILMFPVNKKAYLYRPSTKQVLVEAPLLYEDPNASMSASTGNPKVLVEEGSKSSDNVENSSRGKILVEPK